VNGIQNARKSFGCGVALSGIVALSITFAAHGLFSENSPLIGRGFLAPRSESGFIFMK
jgi:hypothetical protein